MKFLIMLLAFHSLGIQAASVVSAKIDSARENILVDVIYAGGCKAHYFSLKIGECYQGREEKTCKARLVEKVEGGEDTCQAIKHETAVINIKKNGLDSLEFNGVVLIISGERSFRGEETSAVVGLPWKY